MANARAYGSITIVDIGDLGTLSVYPEANQPQYVIYDPNNKITNTDGTTNTDECYNPNWSNSNLVLTPTIYYGGTHLNPSQINATKPNSLKITWKRYFDTYDPTQSYDNSLDTTNEIVGSDLTLTVKGNILSETNRTVVYMCEVEYVEPQTNKTLRATGRISFGLIVQATKIKSCRVTGGSAFLYNSDKQLTGAESITLEAHTANCGNDSWQYKNSDGEYEVIKAGNSEMKSSTLYINLKENKIGADKEHAVAANPDSLFINDVATIRFQSNDKDIYDIHTITKIYDGAAGADVLNATLSNEDMYIPCDSGGTPTSTAFDNANTKITIYNGDTNITNYMGVTINATPDDGVQGEWVRQPAGTDNDQTKEENRDLTSAEYKVNSLTPDTGKVTFTIKYQFTNVDGKTIEKTIVKTFYLTKLKAGVDGVTPSIYSLELSTLALNKKSDGSKIYTPNSFTAKAYKITGDTKVEYTEGCYKVYTLDSANGNSYTEQKSMGSGENNVPSITIDQATLNGKDYYGFKVELYEKGGSKKLDTQTIAVISDGAKGNDGDGGLTFNLGDYSTQIPCNSNGSLAKQYIINIPFNVYQGIKRLACTAKCDSLPGEYISFVSADGTADTENETGAEGKITITIPQTETFGSLDASNDKIDFNITLETTINNETYSNTQKFTVTRNRKAVDGAAAVTLRVYAKNGNVIDNGGNDVELTCTLTEGANNKTPNWYKWYIFDASQNDYVEINNSTPPLNNQNTTKYQGYTGQTLTVPRDAVDGYASYRVDVSYASHTYSDYISVIDKTDPLQVEIFSTLGDKITNGVGIGCVYAKVYQDGVELDPLQNLTVSIDEPKTKVEGDVWAHIDGTTSPKQVVLKKYTKKTDNTYEWVAFDKSEAQKECRYTWQFGDYDGKTTDLNNREVVNDRFLYIEGSYITKKMQFNLTVEET